MKMEDAIADLIIEFGGEKERVWCDKITAVFVRAVGNKDVPDSVFTKVVKVGRQLKALGVS